MPHQRHSAFRNRWLMEGLRASQKPSLAATASYSCAARSLQQNRPEMLVVGQRPGVLMLISEDGLQAGIEARLDKRCQY